MKEMYTKPVAELEKFAVCDVVTTSGQTTSSGKEDPITTPDVE